MILLLLRIAYALFCTTRVLNMCWIPLNKTQEVCVAEMDVIFS